MTSSKHSTVAIIGAGAHGLVALKDLLEEGFEATAFDRNSSPGGIWSTSYESAVSSLPTTVVNVSRERACFTDFPFPAGTASYPSSQEVGQYLLSYCTHFELWPHLRLQTTISGVRRNDGAQKWLLNVTTKDGSTEVMTFDKLVVASGPQNVAIMPVIPGNDIFNGEIIHSIAFKDPARYAGKTVVVLGIGNSAVDTATTLIGHAKKIYLAHRHGAILLPRHLNNGTSLDHGASYRTFAIRDFLETTFPSLALKFLASWVATIQKKHYDLRPEWRINTPTPSLSKQNPTVSDYIYGALQSGDVTSVHGIKRYIGPQSPELEDGTVLEDVDAVIYCTGYRLDLSWLGKLDPTNLEPNNPHSTNYDYTAPRLYQNILSHEHPDNLAFVGLALVFFAAFPVADLTSMALAQLWSKPSLLPSHADMQKQYTTHRAWRAGINSLPNPAGKGPATLQLETGQFMAWGQELIGTRVDEMLSYGSWEAWLFWWREKGLSRMLYDGVYSPHVWRLFDSAGRRKRWVGAREAIERVNEEVRKRRVDAASARAEGGV
ncbi:hypothetical protein LTR62_005271 [Meristemomyces frigidus]|uniref:Uncharacterized protein n=1 Tax=Meristemomyces frigidus TaxID=1508187 RepID=A0AAN7TL94_9PEZI|nr:hypothetical protein LTR62_005271 [Meristemomyces frigidus]